MSSARSTAALSQLLLLEQVADVRFRDEQIGLSVAMKLDRALVVPLDPATQLLVIGEHQDHGRFCRHLLEEEELLGVGLLGRRLLPSNRALPFFSHLGSLGADEFSIRHDSQLLAAVAASPVG